MLKLIWDNGTPGCLPQWASDELVRRRLGEIELRQRCANLRQQLLEAQGVNSTKAWLRSMEELRRVD